jgi:hypothetical protein
MEWSGNAIERLYHWENVNATNETPFYIWNKAAPARCGLAVVLPLRPRRQSGPFDKAGGLFQPGTLTRGDS